MPRRTSQRLPTPRKQKSGKWFVRVYVDNIEHPITRDTKDECLQEAAALKYGFKNVKKLPTKDKTLRELCQEWIAEAEAHKGGKYLSPSTIAGYDRIMRCRADDIMDIPVYRLTEDRWNDSINAARAKYAPKTIRNTYAFLQEVYESKLGTRLNLSLPEPDSKEMPFLDYTQIEKLLTSIRGHDLEIPVLLALSSCRKSELLAITWDKVDLKRKRILIEGAKVVDKNGNLVYKKENKTKTSTREIPIIEPLMVALEEVPESERTGILCKTATSHLSARIKTILRNAGLTEVTCHGLRHAYASLCFHLEQRPELTAKVGGWKSKYTMEKIYTHIAQQDVDFFEGEFTNFYRNKTPKP